MGRQGWFGSTHRVGAVAVFVMVALVAQPAVGGAVLAFPSVRAEPVRAVPPPPPNPSDDELQAGRGQVHDTAGRVGQLANQVAEAEAALLAVQADVELHREETNKALIDLQVAQANAATALAAADRARRQADTAAAQVTQARQQLDRFAAGSYRQGSTIGSISGFLGSDSPQDLLARAELLDAVGGAHLGVLENMRRARTASANKDSLAREAVLAARAAEQAAAAAKAAADDAYQATLDAEAAQAGRSALLRERKADLERRLAEAQQAVAGLEGQRQRYTDWVAQRDREQAAAAAAAAAAAESSAAGSGAGESASAGSGAAAARAVISRAMRQLGVRYSWGGGNARGPTTGIRDGGVADVYGDYRRVGFDCSGLMIYAFAPVLGYSLPHYSGAQHHAGRKVPLSRKRPGDLLFWSVRGRIHHVALYIGNGQMIEAPYSGGAVRIAPVRYGGILPYATRLL